MSPISDIDGHVKSSFDVELVKYIYHERYAPNSIPRKYNGS